jgi:hypothetical protein
MSTGGQLPSDFINVVPFGDQENFSAWLKRKQ